MMLRNLIFGAALLLAVGGAFWQWSRSEKAAVPPVLARSSSEDIAARPAPAPAPAPPADAVTLFGTVMPAPGRYYELRAANTGVVRYPDRVPAVGDRVSQGQQLGVVENELILHDQVHLFYERWTVVSKLMEVEKNAAEIQLELRRAQDLQAQQLASQRDVDQRVAALRSANSQIAELKAIVAKYEELMKKTEKTKVPVISPLTGMIARASYAQGQQVNEGDLLFSIIDLSVVWVEVKFFQDQLPLFQRNKSFEIETGIYPDRKFAATLVQVGSAVDPATKKLSAFLSMPNREEEFRIGMSVVIHLEQNPAAEAQKGRP
jgi:RND family efflux transporter MFP subunit